ncbi:MULTISPECIES: porin [unclassified Duganella]|uniref:porin n=1 Tax=unclassified Duganella TaxID=2636909 RepID=UPI000E350898|nr:MULTISPECIES: porin [unclassified Duganella]RFP19557.1 porin [Duganella sp. BJB475]RFP36138.1 porin [Duganella sp. BJB476]
MKMLRAMLIPLACVMQQAAAQSAVSLYGVVDLAIVADRDSGKSTTAVNSGQQTASRFGIKGDEDLGGGMRASFVVESQIEADTGNPSFAGRTFGSQSWVGLSGNFGSIKLGRMFTPYFGAIATNDPFDAKGPGESTRVFQDSGVRMDNTVKYSLPDLQGFYADLAYGAGEVAGNAAANRQVSADAGYAAGPLNVELAYHDTNDALGVRAARSTLVAGNYDFGPLRGWMVLARSRNATTLDTRDTLVGVSIPFSRSLIAADVVHKTDRIIRNANATQLALGYYYTLSKRTNLYVVSSNLRNGSAASYQAALPGGTRRLVSAGMRHQF